MTIIDGIGPAPAPISSLKNPQVRLPPLESNVDYGQLTCDVASRDRVAEEICRDFPYGGRVLFLGDDDLVSEAVALAGFSVTVVDVDERIGQCLATVEADLSFVLGDVRRPLEAGQFDAVVLDPADGSVALNHWLNRVHEHLGDEEGVRVYLSVNMHRLGRRWASLLAGLARRDLVPVRSQERIKRYPSPSWADTTTDLWVFERMALPSSLPVPYVEIETNR
ncbi:bis-aminopropyl spermidine synthase family protein [Propioniciclava sp. MC1683]|uniref:bis-aminopropyl spermidine synthase family protein n=1 Tax=Propioniciclava sp. MC1683 TaxID=2760309 RepID=UPI0016044A97|nr:bis-aminopropyl spermidine synthase family protein [Propioniciclava sp. MC1683]MBB1501870.1 bis-aminopropyl spermidine synthase family protein [Propioniciclava sp. MC1683]